MNVSVLLRTTEHCGDHSRDVTVACAYGPNETVEALVARLLSGSPMDSVELRVLKPVAPTEAKP